MGTSIIQTYVNANWVQDCIAFGLDFETDFSGGYFPSDAGLNYAHTETSAGLTVPAHGITGRYVRPSADNIHYATTR